MEGVETSDGPPVEVQIPEILTIDDLVSEPMTFRKRLEVVVDGLPWDRVVESAGNNEVHELIRFCLNVNNTGYIESSIYRVFEGNPLSEDTKRILDSIEERQTKSTLTEKVLKKEVIFRKRLVAWMDFFDEIEEARLEREPTIDNGHEDERESE